MRIRQVASAPFGRQSLDIWNGQRILQRPLDPEMERIIMTAESAAGETGAKVPWIGVLGTCQHNAGVRRLAAIGHAGGHAKQRSVRLNVLCRPNGRWRRPRSVTSDSTLDDQLHGGLEPGVGGLIPGPDGGGDGERV